MGKRKLSGLFGDNEKNPSQTPEPYRVLARKYRPHSFAELIGQEAMVRTLTNAIQSARLPQAWMLTGVRGIGKTTTARLIAKALNCTGRKKGDKSIEPCGACESCCAITEDRHVDVQEMDAASRTGVDDIREIIDSVRYGPVSAKYKIYILDEVHMLSKNAFNALLKTLEEPPPHTKFIFATTEIRKVPVTVLSRCQRFDLRRIDAVTLTSHFTHLADLEKVPAEEEALKLIARAADGSVRDGLSLLDQAIALGKGEIKEGDVKEMLGLADRAASLDLCRQSLNGKMVEALKTFDDMVRGGADALQTLQDMAELVHFLTRMQILKDNVEALDFPEAEKQLANDLANIKIPALTRAWQILLKGIGEVQAATNPCAAAEMVLIRLAYAAELPLPGDLIRQLRTQKEKAVTVSLPVSPPPSSGGSVSSHLRAVNSGPVVAARSTSMAQETAPASAARAVLASSPAPMPSTFRDIVALFAANREGGLYAELSSLAHLVHMTAGKLELNLEKKASPSLASRTAQCLTQWTGQRWMVAVVEQKGELTLLEQDRDSEKKRQEKVQTHPLMRACKEAFPKAKLVSLKQKQTAPIETDEGDVTSVDDEA
ncbi:MAG TPA: DNA polymerase III subunit gamma/tau [Rhodospirillaceae bacterium]|nr:DNA polymerase III subunit gamma/tau [Rhodospirillaceae bacterium]